MPNLARQDPLPSLEEPYERLKWARLRAFPKSDATKVAKDHGWPVSTYLSHENGTRGFKRERRKYARAYKVPAAWLEFGQESMIPPIDPELATLWDSLAPDDREDMKRLMRRLANRAA